MWEIEKFENALKTVSKLKQKGRTQEHRFDASVQIDRGYLQYSAIRWPAFAVQSIVLQILFDNRSYNIVNLIACRLVGRTLSTGYPNLSMQIGLSSKELLCCECGDHQGPVQPRI